MDEPSYEDVTGFKIKCLLIIFATGLIGGLLPLKLRVKDRLLSLGNTLSGGVFLSAGIAHMLPEAVEGFEKLDLQTKLPVAYIFCMLGMLGTFFVEKVIVTGRHSHSVVLDMEASSEESPAANHHYHASMSRGIVKTDKNGVVGNSWLLPFLLSIHSLVEGAALGIEDNIADTTNVLIAIIGHKMFAAFALGVNLAKNNVPSDKLAKMVFVFAVMTPLGILFGLMAMWNTNQDLLAECVKALSAGTFIYIALVEVILEEFDNPRDKYIKFFLVIIGSLLMTLVSNAGHTHGGHVNVNHEHR